MLTDLCNVSGPFSKVLSTLRDELVRSIYSDYYSMEQQGLQFSQLPYFKAAERLEADNQHLQQEKDAFKKVLLRRQVLTSSLAESHTIDSIPTCIQILAADEAFITHVSLVSLKLSFIHLTRATLPNNVIAIQHGKWSVHDPKFYHLLPIAAGAGSSSEHLLRHNCS